ncbi:MAG: tetratricopeptide repeat protein [Chloroflexota bacterium]
MPNQLFLQALEKNLAYWLKRLETPDDKLIDEHSNLLQAVKFGHVLPETRAATHELMLQSFSLIEAWGQWSTWLPIIEQAIESLEDNQQLIGAKLLNRYGRWLRISRQLDEAVAVHKEAVALGEKAKDPLTLAVTYLNLGEDYLRLHHYALSEEYGRKALELFNQLDFGVKYEASTHNLLGLVAFEQGLFKKAEKYLRRAIPIWEKCEDKISQARSLKNLGFILSRNDQPHAALLCYQDALNCLNKEAAPLAWIELQNNLAILHYNWRQYNKPTQIFKRADRAARQLQGAFQITASLSQNLGSVLLKQERVQEAFPYFERAKLLWTQFKNDLELANTLGSLGDYYRETDQILEAKTAFQEALDLFAQFPDNAWAKKLQAEYEQKFKDIISNTMLKQ